MLFGEMETTYCKRHTRYKYINSLIPLACAECNDSLPLSGASSIPLCYVLFPATLLHQPFFHLLSPHLAIYFLVYLSNLVVPRFIYRVSQEEWTKLRESVPYVKLYRCNPKHLYPKLNGYGDTGHRKVWASGVFTYCTPSVTPYSPTAHARQRDTAS